MRLADKVAIVTGSASGFGRATAVRFAEEGAQVVVVDLHEHAASETVELIADAGSEGALVVADVSTVQGAEQAAATAVEQFGGLDVLVNNAGVIQDTAVDSWACDEAEWDRVLQTNLKSVYVCTRACVPLLLERGQGSLVNVASIAASCCIGGAAYAASKGGIISFTRHISHELAGHNVRANCVSPGFMVTPMTTGERHGLTADQRDAQLERFARRIPMRHLGTADDVAEAILYLAGEESAYITGQEVVVDGGYLVR